MGKVKKINSSRKEFKCNKCNKVIPKGSTYYRGEINFGPTIIRCENCGLKGYEVTTSDYVRTAGELVEDWRENYSIDESGLQDLISAVEELKDDLSDRLDNMPYQLQEADTGMLLQDRIDGLDSAQSDLESIDVDSLYNDAVSDMKDELDFEDEYKDLNEDDFDDWSSAQVALTDAGKDDLLNEIETAVELALSEAIDEALSSIEY